MNKILSFSFYIQKGIQQFSTFRAPKKFLIEIYSYEISGDIRRDGVSGTYYLYLMLQESNKNFGRSLIQVDNYSTGKRLAQEERNHLHNCLFFYKNSVSGGGSQDVSPQTQNYSEPIKIKELTFRIDELANTNTSFEFICNITYKFVPMTKDYINKKVLEKKLYDI